MGERGASVIVLFVEKFFQVYSRFAENRTQRSFSHFARMMRKGDFAATYRVTLHFMASGTRAVKFKTH